MKIVTATETISATLVSPSWDFFIGQSSTSMKKLNLSINGRKYFISGREHLLKDELKMLSESCRKYENFIFYAQRPGFLSNEIINLLASHRGKWKNIKVWSEKFVDEEQLENFIETFVENADSVDLRNIKMPQEFQTKRNFACKKLKDLKLSNLSNAKVFLDLFQDCKNLEVLEIEGCVDSLGKFLESRPKIRKLSIIETKLNDHIFNNLTEISSFKLKELHIKTDALPCSEFIKFLETQADSIEKLTLDAKCNDDALEMIFKLPYLVSLHILTPPADFFVNLPVNASINKFQINFRSSIEIFLKFIDAMPNLRRLELSSSEKKVIEVIKQRLPNLEFIFL